MDDKVKELQEQLGASKLREESLMAAIEERDETIELLNEELAKAPSVVEAKIAEIPTETFEHGGKEYHFIVPTFHFEGTPHIASEALNDEDLLTELVKRQSGVIQEVETV
jgi:hypothetical protein